MDARERIAGPLGAFLAALEREALAGLERTVAG
jgi:hypothetical protein